MLKMQAESLPSPVHGPDGGRRFVQLAV